MVATVKQFYHDHLEHQVVEPIQKGLVQMHEYENKAVTYAKGKLPQHMHDQVERAIHAWHAVAATFLAITNSYACVCLATLYFGGRSVYALKPFIETLLSQNVSKEAVKAAWVEVKKNFEEFYKDMRPSALIVASVATAVQICVGVMTCSPTQLALIPLFVTVAYSLVDKPQEAPQAQNAQQANNQIEMRPVYQNDLGEQAHNNANIIQPAPL